MGKKRNFVDIYFLIFILIVMAYLASFIYSSVKYAAGIKTVATVTDAEHKTVRKHHTKGGSSKSNLTYITYEYTDGNERYENTLEISGKKHIEKGDEIKIAYATGDHKKAYLFDQIIWHIMPMLFFICITIIQLLLYKRFRKIKPDGPYETDEVI
ncbi:MAG: DUF3592 domain-containing protein [Lachnospiraceae bacterium]|nr:DUF3592 domain-containing protein [Lachnospiraceae bacterium]